MDEENNINNETIFKPGTPKKSPPTLGIIVVIVVVIIVGLILWLRGRNSNDSKVTTSPTATATVSASSNTEPAAPALASVTSTALANTATKWKTYSAAVYGKDISFRYPNTWSLTESKSTQEPGYLIQLKNGNDNQLVLNIWPTATVAPASLEQNKSDLAQTAKSGNFNVSFSDIQVGGQPAMKITFSNLSDIEKQSRANPQAAVVNNGLFYSFESHNDAAAILDQIISTFKFAQAQ